MTVDYFLIDYIKPLGITKSQHALITEEYVTICEALKEIPDHSGILRLSQRILGGKMSDMVGQYSFSPYRHTVL